MLKKGFQKLSFRRKKKKKGPGLPLEEGEQGLHEEPRPPKVLPEGAKADEQEAGTERPVGVAKKKKLKRQARKEEKREAVEEEDSAVEAEDAAIAKEDEPVSEGRDQEKPEVAEEEELEAEEARPEKAPEVVVGGKPERQEATPEKPSEVAKEEERRSEGSVQETPDVAEEDKPEAKEAGPEVANGQKPIDEGKPDGAEKEEPETDEGQLERTKVESKEHRQEELDACPENAWVCFPSKEGTAYFQERLLREARDPRSQPDAVITEIFDNTSPTWGYRQAIFREEPPTKGVWNWETWSNGVRYWNVHGYSIRCLNPPGDVAHYLLSNPGNVVLPHRSSNEENWRAVFWRMRNCTSYN